MHTPEPDSSRAAPEARFSEPGFRDHPVIFGGRRAIRSAASCTLALEGLTLALEGHVQKAAQLEKQFATLDAQYAHAKHKASLRADKARAKGVPLRMRGLGKAKERLRTYVDVRGELSEEIEQILFFRSLIRATITALATRTDHALNLAIFRIVFLLTVLRMFDIESTVAIAQTDAALRVFPRGYAFIGGLIPFDPLFVRMASLCFVATCLCALAGFRTRVAMLAGACLSVYLLGLPQFFGKINHTHHLTWIFAVLALAPCADTLSVDSFLAAKKWKKRPSKSREIGFAMTSIWALYGVAYFFPGYWKLRAQGLEWVTGSTLKNWLHLKWFELDGFLPGFRVDLHPNLLTMSAAAVIAFELLFWTGALSVKVRPILIASAVAFHGAVGYFMDIDFSILWIPLLGLLDWHGIGKKIGVIEEKIHREEEGIGSVSANLLIVSATLIVANIYCGFRYLDTWPLGTYPAFASNPGESVWTLRIEAIRDDKTISPSIAEGSALFGGTARWLTIQQGLISSNDRKECEALTATLMARHPHLRDLGEARFFAERRLTDPALRDAEPLEIREICTQ